MMLMLQCISLFDAQWDFLIDINKMNTYVNKICLVEEFQTIRSPQRELVGDCFRRPT